MSTDAPQHHHSPHGLTSQQVEESRQKYGSNLITPPERDPWWKLYLEKFEDPIIRILVIAAVIALLVGLRTGHYIEGIGILVAILLATGIAFLNEYQAAKEFDLLNRISDAEDVQVIRDGKRHLVPKKDLVVGDVVIIEQGAEIPADGKVLSGVSLSLNEASLTGESVPVDKEPLTDDQAEGEAAESGHAYPRNVVLRGTTVSDGHGLIQLTAVGDRSEIGKTARAAAEDAGTDTPLSRQLERLAGVISIGAFAAAIIIFIAQTVRGAFSGEVHDITERAGNFVPTPLTGGQWYCFILLFLAVAVLSSQIWLPVFRDACTLLHRSVCLPQWTEQTGRRGLLHLLGGALVLMAAGILLGLATGILNWRYGYWLPMSAMTAFLGYFMLAVTVIVVAVPEGLPMCVTLSLAYSMRKMTASNNLVRKMHACETIGAASVICSDKTGTLTMNEMRVHRAVFPFLAEGKLAPAGAAGSDRLTEAAAANSTANLAENDTGNGSGFIPMGNPTEAAILLWLENSGRNYQDAREDFEVKQQLAFSTERKFMATAGLSAIDRQPTLYAKGAPEILLAFCATARDAGDNAAALSDADRKTILDHAASYQNRGMRVLGFASKRVSAAELGEKIPAPLSGLTWEGFFVIADPIRPEVPGAVDRALSAGIKVKVVTGDNQATAREIARQAGLWKDTDTDAQIVQGEVFEAMSDAEAAETAKRIKVMSRARPLHKLRLVKLLQEQGEVVAVTGDGTNDAPALNHADVGLAMGRTGTAVAKEAADIILLDDSFGSIVNAVAWGRSLYANIQKFIVFQLTINVAAVGIALLGPFFGVTLPLTVVQMLWVNLIMDTFAALALASEPPDWGLMKNPPRPAGAFIITKPMQRFIFGVGFAFLGLFLLTLAVSHWFPLDADATGGRHNLTIFFTAFVFLQFWNLWNARVFGTERSAFSHLGASKGFLLMAAVIVLGQILLVHFGGEMFRVTPLSLKEWLAIVVLTSPVLWIGEAWRLHMRSSPNPEYWVYS